ncbi:YcbK family protein [Silvibacterium dinghuense]|nr:DUF882 domain-containing protein [Silvibacterium dinghuense]
MKSADACAAGSLFCKARKIRFFRCLVFGAAIAAFLLGTANAHARTLHRHPRFHAVMHMLFDTPLPSDGLMPLLPDSLPTAGKPYELKLTRQEDGQSIDVVYRIGDIYIPQALDALNRFLHDTHNGEVASYDPRTFDVLHTILVALGKSSDAVDILSAYRTQQTNDWLREQGGTNAAEHSQHIVAKALDIRVPGVSANILRDAALSLHAGGVGYYPRSQFVHVDVGPVRQWTYSPHERYTRGGHDRHAHARIRHAS